MQNSYLFPTLLGSQKIAQLKQTFIEFLLYVRQPVFEAQESINNSNAVVFCNILHLPEHHLASQKGHGEGSCRRDKHSVISIYKSLLEISTLTKHE